MTKLETIELVLIPIFGVIIWLSADLLPVSVSIGELVLVISALLLLQSLIRDLWLLMKQKKAIQHNIEPPKEAQCMCVESTVGATGVVIGFIVFGLGVNLPIHMSDWRWSILIIIVMIASFIIKDYVLEWNPLRIRRDKDHMNIIFTWKAQ